MSITVLIAFKHNYKVQGNEGIIKYGTRFKKRILSIIVTFSILSCKRASNKFG